MDLFSPSPAELGAYGRERGQGVRVFQVTNQKYIDKFLLSCLGLLLTLQTGARVGQMLSSFHRSKRLPGKFRK